MIIGSQAEIIGNLKYESPKEVDIEEGANILGVIDYNKKEIKEIVLFKSLGFIFGILIMIVAGLALMYFFKNITERVVKGSLTDFWPSLGRGFAALILTPIVAIILLITVAGIGLAGLIISAYAFMLTVSAFLASIAFGSWLIKIIRKQEEYKINWQAVIVGVISLKLIVLIPFVGWLVGFVFMLISLGVLYQIAFQGLVSRK